MRYISTRGAAPACDFPEVVLAGLAADGGLYVPESVPRFRPAALRAMQACDYGDLAARVMAPFVGAAIARPAFERMVADSYAGFGHPAVAPLKQLGPHEWLLELFHGPTLAFKDYALQLVGRLFDHLLSGRGTRLTLIAATSGDTGSAAIAACRDRAALDIFVLHPKGRISEVQRRQMTTVDSANVHNIAVEGTFDDCQELVKAMFADAAFNNDVRLSAVNSINWARIMAQTVYYFAAGLALGAPDREVSFAVPTGNFGNAFAGHVARAMGLPIRRLVVGSNRNDILTRFFKVRDMTVHAVEPSLSPSMDIQVSSNFERLLFDLYGGDGARVAAAMEGFRQTGRLDVDAMAWRAACETFAASSLDDDGTRRVIREVFEATGELVDPHTAVGIHAGRAYAAKDGVPMVMLATAHPAKFPEAVEQATGVHPALPPALADLMTRREHYRELPNELAAVQAHVRAALRERGVS